MAAPRQTASGQPTTGASSSLDSERRRVTILFADLVGFTTLAEEMDPEELRTLITETFAKLTAEVTAREGRVEKFIGDSIMAEFGGTLAHEDDPDRAVDTALRMLEVVRRRSEATGIPLELRVGINSGLVVTGGVGDGTQAGVMGDAVNVAARLQASAGPGEIFVSAGVWRRVRERYDAQHVGPVAVKGRGQLIDVYRILGPQQAPGRRQAPFVGRLEELRLLELLWSNTVKGNTHVVSVVGEPGVGKSRLMSELPPREDALDLRVRCESDQAFGPFLDLLDQILGGKPASLEELTRRTIALGVKAEVAGLLGTLFGLSGAPPVVAMADEQQKRQVFSGMWQFLIELLRNRAALIVFDDVHWADRSSLELLAFLLERLGGVPLTMILAYRPGFERVERTTLRAGHTLVRLDLLPWEDSAALARGFLGVDQLPPDLEHIVGTRAEGNPFFIEELLQALLELGSLAVVDGQVILARVELEIPDTVEGTILARVDRQPAAARAVLQLAAVVGRRFSVDLLEAVLADQDVAASLQELARAQLVVPLGPGEWSFKHAMIQEVTYQTLLHRQRRELHGKVGDALERDFRDDPRSLELLAEHYAKAENPEKGRRYALAAGDAARERTGFAEARILYERALALWGENDVEGRAAVLMRLGWAALLTADSTLARTALIEAEAAWQSLGNTREAALALAMLGRSYFFAGDSERSADVLQRAIDLLEPEGPSPELVQTHVWRSIMDLVAGSVAEGTVQARKGLLMAEDLDLMEGRAALEISLGSFAVRGGDPRGVDQIRRGLQLAEKVGDIESVGRAYINLGIAFADLDRNSEGVSISEEGRHVLRKLGALSFEWAVASKEADMLAEMGRFEDANDLAGEALGPHRAVLIRPGVVWAGGARTAGLLRRGRYEEAREQLDEILPVARLLGGSMFPPIALLLEAELQTALGNQVAARQAVVEALDAVLDTTSTADQFRVAVAVGRLLPERLGELLDRCGRDPETPAFQACLREAEAAVAGDPARFGEAADLYAALGIPYREAECRLDAGDLEGAAELVRRLGLERGPIGTRLATLGGAVS